MLLKLLREQKNMQLKGSLYHRTQIDFSYNSNRIEGSRLTLEQTRHIFETNTLEISKEVINIDDIIETINHFRCVDLIIEHANLNLTDDFIKKLHYILKTGTSAESKSWFNIGDYKKLPNEVGGQETCSPEEVSQKMKELLSNYQNIEHKNIEDIIDFHYKFELIHPFQDGNGRVGRLIMFKECLKNNIIPFIITDEIKYYYYRGLQKWATVKEYLLDTCLNAQDNYKELLKYFKIEP